MNRTLAAALTLCACGISRIDQNPSDPGQGEQQDLSPTKVERLYAVRPDPRECPSPACGGWFVRALNLSGGEQYVATLDWHPSGFDQQTIDTVLATPADHIILSGAVVQDALLVTGAWLGLPGVTPSVDSVYAVTATPLACASCPTLRASLVNTAVVQSAFGLSVKHAALPRVQVDWLEGRVIGHGALVSASVPPVASSTGAASVIDASQVWLAVPDAHACSAQKPPPCQAGYVQTFTRDADRCLQPSGCVKPLGCPLFFPACDAGYRLASWPATPSGCDAFACDPAFVAP